MKLRLDVSPIEAHPSEVALRGWYASHPVVRRLWVIEKATNGEQANTTRVIVAIEPTLDGDETSPTWIANGHAWARELDACMGHRITLEMLERPLQDEMEIDGEGRLVAVQSWRESYT
jgi:hypothetical protein